RSFRVIVAANTVAQSPKNAIVTIPTFRSDGRINRPPSTKATAMPSSVQSRMPGFGNPLFGAAVIMAVHSAERLPIFRCHSGKSGSRRSIAAVAGSPGIRPFGQTPPDRLIIGQQLDTAMPRPLARRLGCVANSRGEDYQRGQTPLHCR